MARYIVQACNSNGCVDSDEQIVSGSLESAIGYFKASNTDPEDYFGGSVSLSAEGNCRCGVGFLRSNGGWQHQAYLNISNAGQDDRFGSAVSLSADGNTLAVGAYSEARLATGINGDQNDLSALSS